MKFFQKSSIKRKQTLIAMLTSGVALLLACAAFGAYEVITFRAAMVQNLSTLAEIIGNNSSAALDFSDPKAARETLSALRAEPNIVGACIYAKNGEIFAVYGRPDDRIAFSPPAYQADHIYFSNNLLYLFRPIVHDGEFLGTVCVVSDLNALYSRLDRYALIAIGVFFASALVAFLLSSKLLHYISGPILNLVETARAVTVEKNYSIRAAKQSADEIGVLIDAFNEMLRQIQVRDANLQNSHVELEKRVTERTGEVVNSLSLLRATLESTTDGILVTDGNRRVTSFNEQFVKMWKIPRANANVSKTKLFGTLMGHGTKYEASHPSQPSQPELAGQLTDPGQFLSKIDELYAEPEKESFDLLEFKDGRVFERYSKPQRVEEKSFGRVWSFRDITERRQAEAELSYERDLLRSLLDNSPDQIYFKDLQSRFLKSSKAQAVNFGLKSANELLGKTDFDFFSEAHARPAFEDEQKIIRTGRPIVGQVEKETWTDGRVTWVLTSKMALRNKDGEIIGTFGLSRDITAIKQAEIELAQVNKLLIETSRQAGMAEVATSVLHNVGNVLNSVNVSSSLVSTQVRKSKIAGLTKVVALLNEHAADIGAFLTTDPKGKQVPAYLGQLAEHLVGEQNTVLKELNLLHENIEHIKDIVVMQQSYAKISGVVETVKIADLVEDALHMNLGALLRHGVEVRREFEDVPPMDVEKHKILQILVNLVRNAKYACDESLRTDKRMTLRVARTGDQLQISVIDNGIGIPPENLTRIFSHGFTTRKDGHGFGLHSAALAAMEMGGSLRVHSDGPGKGATFTLQLPYKPHEYSPPRNENAEK